MTALPDGVTNLHTPALLVDLDAARDNIARTLELVGSPDRWRPHLKTTKLPEVWRLLLDAGVTQFKCATTKEARALLDCATDPVDLLVAMAHRGANLDAIAALARRRPDCRVSVLTESPEHAELVRERAPALGLFVDLDPGYTRTGIPHDQRARIRATATAAGDALRGLHDYDGHLHDADSATRRTACERIYAELVEIADELELPRDHELITSGTPTFPIAATSDAFAARRHRVSPGTVVFWDLTSAALGIDGYRFAATVLARVISAPTPTRITLDAGSKAVDAAAGDPCCAIAGYEALAPQRPSEEHLPVRVDAGAVAPDVGDLVALVPRHVCPTVNLADTAVLVEAGRVTGIVPVAARGHDTVSTARIGDAVSEHG